MKLILLAFPLLLLSSSLGASTTVVLTDSTWLAADAEPGAGWESSLAFDDSMWGNAIPLMSSSVDGSTVDALWYNGDILGGPTTIWLRKVFTLADAPANARLSGVVDDDAQIYLNGNLVVDDQSGSAEAFLNNAVAPYLVAGQNLLAVRALDTGGYHYFALRLAASETCGSGSADAGEQCDDGNLIDGDCCAASCQYEASGSSCAADGNLCTRDTCNGLGTCGQAQVGCKGAGKSIVALKYNTANDKKDKFLWKWLKGAEATPGEWGGEVTVCLFASTGDTFLGSASMPDGGQYWTPLPKGWKFQDPTRLPNGIKKSILKGGAAGKSKIIVKGGKGNVPDFLNGSVALPLRIQMVSSASTCFESVFNTSTINDGIEFEATAE